MSQNEKLKAAFTTSIGVAPGSDFNNIAYGKTDGWDSVAHMALVAEIESAFDIMLETDDVIGMSSFPEARRILGKHGIDCSD
jgi:acyl carrier protein